MAGLGASAVLVATTASIYVLAGGVMSIAWQRWHTAESLWLCGSPEDLLVRLGLSGFIRILTKIAGLGLIVWAALPHLSMGPAWAWIAAAVGPTLVVIWSAIFPFVGLRPERIPARA